jgi:hypothetical protein
MEGIMSRLEDVLDPAVVRRVDLEVERLFKENPLWGDDVHGNPVIYRNPVTGGLYIKGIDPIEQQKEEARRPLLAREWFRIHGPADAQPLPAFYTDRTAHDLLTYVVRLYGRSLAGRDYDVSEHPPFADYVRGVLWESELPDGGFWDISGYPIEEVRALKKRYPPRMLKGMGPGACWEPPKVHTETINSLRRSGHLRVREIAWFYRA